MAILDQNEALRESAITKLQAIKHALISVKGSGNLGLMGGDTGIALFFTHYYQFTQKEEDLEIAIELIEYITNQTKYFYRIGKTFSSGITGFGWLLQHINSLDILEINTGDFLTHLDEILYPIMMDTIRGGNYDYLHGALGIGLYYLSRVESGENRKRLSDLVESLHVIARKDGHLYAWDYYDTQSSILLKDKLNFGLAHGMPGILQFLINVYKAGIAVDLALEMIEGTKRNLMLYRNDFSVSGSFFSYTSMNKEKDTTHSRLAWCYGDLGVCMPLYSASLCTTDEILRTEILKMLEMQTTRRDLQREMIWDAQFCHGASGLAHIFNKIYQLTANPIFGETSLFWYGQTLIKDTFSDGLAGYKTFRSLVNPIFENDAGLLEGITGIGLSLLSGVSNTPARWDEMLLLN